jgi:creatinine amidohydrolase
MRRFKPRGEALLVKGMTAYAQSGVIGRPSLGSADKGRAVLDSLVRSFADVLSVLDMTVLT